MTRAPIIIVGAGRSGTTRLNAALGAHPDVHMIGETSFLLRRLWEAFNERPSYSRPAVTVSRLAQQRNSEWRDTPWWKFWYEEVGRDLGRVGPVVAEIEEAETARLQRAFGDFFAGVMIPPALRKPRWGFKEIWAGSALFPCDWALYRGAFPEARYVQSIRHPLRYLDSCISNAGAPAPTEDEAVHALGQWVVMVRHSRSLRDTGRYLEYRMEDFDTELPRILKGLDLEPDPACTAAGKLEYLPSQRRHVLISTAAIDRVDGLRELAAELDYQLS